MPQADFSHVTTWVFDLDNTLYPPTVRLFDQIEIRMNRWIVNVLGITEPEAEALRIDYWARYGTTLAGLMREHGVDPAPYLTDVHDIDFSVLPPEPELANALCALPGRRIVYTNGCEPYAQRVLEARGLADVFDQVYGIEHANFLPKPEKEAFKTIFAVADVEPQNAAMFEDDPRNLMVPYEMGMKTVHVAPRPKAGEHIHYHTSELTEFVQWVGE